MFSNHVIFVNISCDFSGVYAEKRLCNADICKTKSLPEGRLLHHCPSVSTNARIILAVRPQTVSPPKS